MTEDSRRYHRRRPPPDVRFQFAGGSSPETVSPFGGIPGFEARQLARSYYGPLARFFGMGPQAGTPAATRRESQLAGATGPLADIIRQFQAFEPSAFPEAQAIGKEVSARGSAAFTTLQSQIDQALAALPGYQAQAAHAADLASQYAGQAFSPVANEDLFRTAENRLTQSVNQGAAARGGLDTGAAQQAQTDAVRQLVMGFRGQQDAMQQAAIPMLANAASGGAQLAASGIPIAAGGMEAVQQLGQLLSAQYGIPEAQAQQLLGILMGGAGGQGQLLSATAPVVAQQQPDKFGLLNWIF